MQQENYLAGQIRDTMRNIRQDWKEIGNVERKRTKSNRDNQREERKSQSRKFRT